MFFSLGLFLSPLCIQAAGEPRLPLPTDSAQKDYLGLAAGESFSLTDIDSEYIIVEVFSYYCSLCRKEAADVNRVFSMIGKNPNLKNRLKIIGVGIGSDADEVLDFRKKHSVLMPLFPDKKLRIMKELNARVTPTFVLLKKGPDNALEKVWSKTGSLGTPEKFLAEVEKQAGF